MKERNIETKQLEESFLRPVLSELTHQQECTVSICVHLYAHIIIYRPFWAYIHLCCVLITCG